MELILEIVTGPSAGRRIVLEPGQTVRVGRAAGTEFCVPFDRGVSILHFAVAWESGSYRLRDQGSTNGTFVNGERVTESVLDDGDRITIGETTLVVRLSAVKTKPTPPQAEVSEMELPAPIVPQGEPRDLLALLRNTPDPLFAIIDAARDPILVLTFLHACPEEHQSLFEGPKGDELAAAAPYLIQLSPASSTLEKLVQLGWGKSWGIFLTCREPFKEVRKHFRHFLLVKMPDGKEAYFRFYDPRVLRVYLPTCKPEECQTIFGPVNTYLMEAADPSVLLTFTSVAGVGVPAAIPLLAKAELPA
jgi:hypothetical protein